MTKNKNSVSVRRDVRVKNDLDIRISNVIKFFQAKLNPNYCFADFARKSFEAEVERVEKIIKNI